MITIAVAGRKGGVGKTTTVCSLAACLAARKQRVLCLDMDAQGNLTSWLGGDADQSKAWYDILKEGRPLADQIVASTIAGVDLVPSSEWTAVASDWFLSTGGDEHDVREQLRALAKPYDYVLIDTPGAVGPPLRIGLIAADGVLFCTDSNPMGLQGLATLMKTVAQVKKRANPGLEVYGALVTKVARRNISQEVIESLRKSFGDRVLGAVIRENARLAEAPSHQAGIVAYDPKGNGTEDYRAATKELLQRIKMVRERAQEAQA